MKLVLYWLLLFPTHGISGRLCGFPGKPKNGDFLPQKRFYDQGEHVTYTCDKGFYFKEEDQDIKEAKRFCQCHGVWNGTVPTCNFFDSVDLIPWTSLFVSGQTLNANKITDEDDSTCGSVIFTANKREIEITAKLLNLTSNRINVTMIVGNIVNDPGDIKATVEIQQMGNHDSRQICEVSKPIVIQKQLNFVCDVTSDSAKEIKIVFRRANSLLKETKINLCSLRVTTITNATCGEPETPFHGEVSISILQRAQYKCEDGYLLLGEDSSNCTQNGTAYYWQSNKPPICISERDRECKVLPEIQNGRLITSMPNCEEDYSFKDLRNTAVLQCDPGYTLQRPKRMAYCSELTNWTWSFDNENPIDSTECILATGQGHGSLLSFLDERIILGMTCVAALVIFTGFVYCFYRCCRKKPDSSEVQRSETAEPVYGNVLTRHERITNRSSYYLRYFRHRSTISQSCVGDNTYAEIDSVAPSATPNAARVRKTVRITQNSPTRTTTPSRNDGSSIDVIYSSVADSISPKLGKHKLKPSTPDASTTIAGSDESVYNQVYSQVSERPRT